MQTSREGMGGEPPDVRRSARAVAAGSVSEMIAGLAAIILAIIGLAGVFPYMLVAIATIVFGVALMLSGGSIAARYGNIERETAETGMESMEIGTGVTTEFAGGLAGIVLGILALIGLVPLVLIPCAVIVYGATFILSSGLTNRLSAIEYYQGRSSARRLTHEAVEASSGVQMLVGLAAITLGILALIGFAPLILSLVAVLAIAVGGSLSSAALTSRMWTAFRAPV
jgi:hypothetical protein